MTFGSSVHVDSLKLLVSGLELLLLGVVLQFNLSVDLCAPLQLLCELLLLLLLALLLLKTQAPLLHLLLLQLFVCLFEVLALAPLFILALLDLAPKLVCFLAGVLDGSV